MNYPVVATQSDGFLSQVRTIKPLSPEREFELAVRYRETGDVQAAHELVVSHLPFVVKIAYQYRHYMLPVQDLIQEGSIGLMKAVKRFDPHKGFRLVSFAVWWIKAYMKNFILRSWNLVRLGTTQAQRKLFFRIGDIGEHFDRESKDARVKELAEELKVKEDDIIEVEARIKAREWSLDQAFGEDKSLTGIDMLEDESPSQEEMLLAQEAETTVSKAMVKAMAKLDERERFIIDKRFFEETPWTLQQIGDRFGTTRERVRQLENRALKKLKAQFTPELREYLIPA
ncbi:MAG: RNA polymerase factor sigma-32 [Thermodesulfobacteriota bacterium]